MKNYTIVILSVLVVSFFGFSMFRYQETIAILAAFILFFGLSIFILTLFVGKKKEVLVKYPYSTGWPGWAEQERKEEERKIREKQEKRNMEIEEEWLKDQYGHIK